MYETQSLDDSLSKIEFTFITFNGLFNFLH